jgi:hypothetical protein
MEVYKTNALLSEMREVLEYYAIEHGMTSRDYEAVEYAIDAGTITSIEQLLYTLADVIK